MLTGTKPGKRGTTTYIVVSPRAVRQHLGLGVEFPAALVLAGVLCEGQGGDGKDQGGLESTFARE